MNTEKAIETLELCEEYLGDYGVDVFTVLSALQQRTALLEELRSARPLLLYGEAWVERIEKVLA